jgi:peptide/nickel transport system permease protein
MESLSSEAGSTTLADLAPEASGSSEGARRHGLGSLLSKLRRRKFESAGLFLAAFAIVTALVGPLLVRGNPYTVHFADRLRPPSSQHLFGTDTVGRDVLIRVVYGARLTLSAVALVVLAAVLIGILIGTTAALSNWLVDEVLMRIADIGLSLPAMVLALGLAAALGAGLRSAIIALAVAWWPGYARLVRTLVIQTRDREFVEAARSLGASRSRLIFLHILPNSLDTLFVQTTLDVANVTVILAGLSFIGVGAQPPDAEWGSMIADGRSYMITGWWVVVFPGLAVALTALGFFLTGDLLRSELDPRLRIKAVG